ncbi:hypothetical protein CW304_29035 [Bacillus sp. UFRGS-B20]|nr:hypothetical protein CW304_29035 [Bacillus sp. UFRGS-B20]
MPGIYFAYELCSIQVFQYYSNLLFFAFPHVSSCYIYIILFFYLLQHLYFSTFQKDACIQHPHE